jgi:Flp pilus assembly protein TadG
MRDTVTRVGPTDRPRPNLLARLRAHLRTRSRGQSLVEFGLILPVFLLLFATTLDLGRLAFARVTVTNAAREGAFQASKTPTDFNSAQPCPADASSNLVVCRVQLEAKSSGVTIAPSDIAVTCDTSGCPAQVPSRVTVRVTGHFTLLTPLMAIFFGNSQNITFSAASTTQVATLPPVPSAAVATPTPVPSSSATPTPSPTATPGVCAGAPSAGFTYSQSPANKKAPQVVTVTDTSSSPNCNIDSWVWDWGDTYTSSGKTPGTHSYALAGTYTITLVVHNAQAFSTQASAQITVKP